MPNLGLKDHIIRERVNELRDITKTYSHTQQLRDHLSKFVADLLREQKEAIEAQKQNGD
jgi:hypothetical protein